MRQHHAAGDKLFVDYSGKKVPIVDPATGVVREAEIFVAVLGASSLTYAEATWSQALPDWIGAHGRLFRFLGGVPRLDPRGRRPAPPAAFRSEWWPASRRNSGRLQIGNPRPASSECAS